jgi:beta-glucosidase
VTVPLTGGWQKWTTATAPATGAAGVHSLYVVFKGSAGIGNINWFRFR